MRNLIVVALSITALVHGTILAASASELSTPAGVRKLFDGLEPARLSEDLPKEHPDYPILVAARAMRADLNGDSESVVRMAENLFVQQKYEGLTSVSSNGKADLIVGNVGSFPIWRELLYLEAGRAYYKLGQTDRAISFFKAVPEASPFALVARLELGWTYLKTRDAVAANDNLGRIGAYGDQMNELQKREFLLQRAYYNLEVGDSARAAEFANQAGVIPSGGGELAAIRSKILAQSQLNLYLKDAHQAAFVDKKNRLEAILKEVESIPTPYRDAEFSFLAGETYWHLASLLRVEDPDKFKSQASSALKRANDWLDPWVDRSLAQKKPLFSEDAFFLSVAVLWEQRKYQAAMPRLLAMPVFFPKGEFLQDAYQLLADYFFDAGEFDRALRYYTELARVGNTEKAAYGVYKAAWTFYNQEEKWKALRHLERLLVHYKEDLGKDEAEAKNQTLLRESQNDMLLIMAELLPWRQAIQELSIFEYPTDKSIAIQERLGTVYKEIGKYEDSIAVLQTLLTQHSKSKVGEERVFKWLGQMLLAQLSSGRRDQLAPSLDRYLPMLPEPSGAEATKLHAEMEKQIVAITLTVHREAKKTEDEDIWRATDAIYRSVGTHYPNSKEPDLWYYGAQRREQLGQKRDAMLWYRKAGSVDGYANRMDSALNAIRLLRDLGGEKAAPKTNYAELAEVAQWYIQTYPKTRERGLAEFMYLEYSDKGKEWKKSNDYLVGVIKTEGFTQEHQDQYLAHNKRLYEAGKWDDSYALAADLSKLMPDDSKADLKGLQAKLYGFQQETAFQAAFNAEKANKETKGGNPEALEAARKWYERAIVTKSDPAVTLKAWHNLIVSYKLPEEAKPALERFVEFEKVYTEPRGLSKEKLSLVLSVYARAVEAWEAYGQPMRRADLLSKSASFQTEPGKAAQMRWDALITFGTYYQINKMKKEFAQIRAEHPQLIADPKNQLTVARLLFWNAAYADAWAMTKAIAQTPDPLPQTWILVGDLFNFTSKMRNIGQGPLHAQIREFLAGQGKKIATIAILQPILTEVLHPQMNLAKLASLEGLDREPASQPGPGVAGQLKSRVGAIGKILRALEQQQSVLHTYTKSPAAQIAVAGLCASPLLKQEAIRRLEQQKETPIQAKQWGELVGRINSKIVELQGIARQEQVSCDQQRQNIAYMKPNQEIISPLCSEYSCFPTVPKDLDDLVAYEQSRRKDPTARLDMLRKYLQLGAWAPAEILAFGTQSPKERTLLLAVIRLAMGDTWNAAPLFKEVATDPQQAPHAYLMLAGIAWRHGHLKLAADQLARIRQGTQFLDWEEKIYDEIRSDCGNLLTEAISRVSREQVASSAW